VDSGREKLRMIKKRAKKKNRGKRGRRGILNGRERNWTRRGKPGGRKGGADERRTLKPRRKKSSSLCDGGGTGKGGVKQTGLRSSKPGPGRKQGRVKQKKGLLLLNKGGGKASQNQERTQGPNIAVRSGVGEREKLRNHTPEKFCQRKIPTEGKKATF